MARFSVENEEDEEFVNSGSKRRRRNSRIGEEKRKKFQKFLEGDEEEEEEADEEGDGEESCLVETTGGRISATVEPDVIQCDVCFDPLVPPLYQCQNGHVLCSKCFTCLNPDKCPTCSQPSKFIRCRALEKVVESMKCSCCYSKYGCNQELPYANLDSHQDSCLHAPCFCPMRYCIFSGSQEQLSAHFHANHGGVASSFQYDEHFKITLKKDEPFHVLQETEGLLFLLINDISSDKGNALSVVCIHPNPSVFSLSYELMTEGSCGALQLQGCPSGTKKWDGACPSSVFLMVPHGFSSAGQITLDVCILRGMGSYIPG